LPDCTIAWWMTRKTSSPTRPSGATKYGVLRYTGSTAAVRGQFCPCAGRIREGRRGVVSPNLDAPTALAA
jgi:hypothetical protein